MLDFSLNNSVFLGLVTHEKSKYLNTFGHHEKFSNLLDLLDIENWSINDRNVTDAESEKINYRIEINSIWRLFRSLIGTQYRILIKSKLQNFNLFAFHTFSGIYTVLMLLCKLLLTNFNKEINKGYRVMIARQYKISEAHIDHIYNASISKMTYSLILEDDFILNDGYPLKDTFPKILRFLDNSEFVKVLSISESFSPSLLGFNHISNFTPFENLNFYNLSTPVTNTVSAMLYKTDIFQLLLPLLKSYRKYKIIPIDHKLNMAFNELLKNQKSNLHLLSYLSPGLFIQGSIHDNE